MKKLQKQCKPKTILIQHDLVSFMMDRLEEDNIKVNKEYLIRFINKLGTMKEL